MKKNTNTYVYCVEEDGSDYYEVTVKDKTFTIDVCDYPIVSSYHWRSTSNVWVSVDGKTFLPRVLIGDCDLYYKYLDNNHYNYRRNNVELINIRHIRTQPAITSRRTQITIDGRQLFLPKRQNSEQARVDYETAVRLVASGLGYEEVKSHFDYKYEQKCRKVGYTISHDSATGGYRARVGGKYLGLFAYRSHAESYCKKYLEENK
jgi:hypothetical protein